MMRGSQNHLSAARAQRRLSTPAHAGRGDLHVGHSKRTRKFGVDRPQLVVLAPSLQALSKSMQ